LHQKTGQLQQAYDAAGQTAVMLKQSHDALAKELNARSTARAGSSTDGVTVNALHVLSDDKKNLSDYDRRIQDAHDLQLGYANWMALVRVHQRAAVHAMIQSALWILLIVLALYLADDLVGRYLISLGSERTRLHTLHAVIRFALQAVAVLLIAFVIFGAPSQTPTVLGLAGAGLTVAMKDFIVAFFGWFVLMGRNGMRVGDWVEINGVAGEVVEINLLRTVLLETGNWTDTGHPTGRKVAFVNSFAIEGHFFNFSTVGQWLWDELQIVVPSSQNPYPIIEAIQKMVNEETAENARAAEQEWARATTRAGVHAVSAAPAVNLRPTGSGVEVHVRYITRANERYATRTHLYQALVGLLHGEEKDAVPASK
jgi:small-conductance mechanosensitive channel